MVPYYVTESVIEEDSLVSIDVYAPRWYKRGHALDDIYTQKIITAKNNLMDNSISSWIAWSGRPTPMTLLGSDWIFNLVNNSDDGMSNYEGNTRKDFIKGTNPVNLNTALTQIDTINQATELLDRLKPLAKVKFEELFG